VEGEKERGGGRSYGDGAARALLGAAGIALVVLPFAATPPGLAGLFIVPLVALGAVLLTACGFYRRFDEALRGGGLERLLRALADRRQSLP
jgi:hypothetical protein